MPRPYLTRAAIRCALRHKPPVKGSLFDDDPPNPYHFFIYLRDREGKRRFIVKDMDRGGVGGFWFETSDSKGESCILMNAELRKFTAQFYHYFPDGSAHYASPLALFWALLTLYPLRHTIWNNIAQKQFNRRPLARASRVAVLRFFIEHTLEKPGFRASDISVLQLMFSSRYEAHPDHEKAERYYSMVMDSLVQTNDLDKTNGSYTLNPKAFSTIHEYEEEEQRHADMVRQQRLLGFLTGALVLTGLLQAVATYWRS